MENNLIKFNEYLKDNPVNKEYNKRITALNNGVPFIGKEEYTFKMCAKSSYYTILQPLITLDEEDINYLANKYLPKLEEEMQNKINKIKEEYGKIN